MVARQVMSESHPRAAQGVAEEEVEARRSEERSDVLRPLNDNKGIINTSMECTCGEKQTVLHGCVLEEGGGCCSECVGKAGVGSIRDQVNAGHVTWRKVCSMPCLREHRVFIVCNSLIPQCVLCFLSRGGGGAGGG